MFVRARIRANRFDRCCCWFGMLTTASARQSLVLAISLFLANFAMSQALGGLQPIDTNNEEVQAFAKKAVEKLNQQSNDANEHIFLKVLEAKSQVVSGVRYEMKVEFGRTNCKKVRSAILPSACVPLEQF